MLLFEGILSDSVMVFAMNQAGKSPSFLSPCWSPLKKKKKTSKRTSKERSPYFWSAVAPVSLVLLKQIGIPARVPARTQGWEHWPAVKWAAWTRTWTPGFSSKCTEFWLSLWISSSDIWKEKRVSATKVVTLTTYKCAEQYLPCWSRHPDIVPGSDISELYMILSF